MENQTLLTFPCDFPIKIIGKKTSTFTTEISDIVHKHFPDTTAQAISIQDSQNGNYVSVTATVHVTEKATLDALYQDLTKHPDIKMVL